MWEAADILAREKPILNKTQFKRREQALGLAHNEDSVLQSVAHRRTFLPISTLTYDSAHVWFSNGVANRELHLLMRSMSQCRPPITWPHLLRWIQAQRSWPAWSRAKGRALWKCFNESREVASKKEFKSGCTETIMIVPLVRHFLVTVVWTNEDLRKQLCKEVMSFNALANVVAVLQKMKVTREPATLAPELQRLISKHMKLKAAAYGLKVFTWKDHVQQHVPGQVDRDEKIIDSLPLERKHQSVKTMAETIANTTDFERTVLIKCISDQLRELQTTFYFGRLIGPQMAVSGGEATMARNARWKGLLLERDDIVVATPFRLGKVLAAMLHTKNSQITLVVQCITSSEPKDGFAVGRDSGVVEGWRLDDVEVRQATCWHSNTDGTLTVIV